MGLVGADRLPASHSQGRPRDAPKGEGLHCRYLSSLHFLQASSQNK